MTGGSRRARWTLRRRLVAVLVGLLACVAGVMGVVSTLALRGTLVAELDSRVQAAGARAVDAPSRPQGDRSSHELPAPGTSSGPASTPDPRPPALLVPGQGAGTVSLFLRDGFERAGYYDDAGEFHELTDGQVDALVGTPTDGEPRTVTLDGLGAYRVVATTTASGDTVVTGMSTAALTQTVARYLAVEVAVAVAGLGLAGVAGTVLVRRELRPLDRVAATATRVAELPLHRGEVLLAERVADDDTDPTTEVGQVGAALNQLLGHVERSLAARHASETQVRQFVADASHELRTPLASIRGYAELVRRLPDELPDDALRAMGRVESEARRMTALVEDLLLLARLDAGRELERAPVDLRVLAIDAVADAHAAGPDHRWHLDLVDDDDAADADDASPAVVLGDDHRLRQVLVNLLSNARVHTPAGTTVSTRVRVQDGAVQLRVTDDGPGISPELCTQLFQRFTRGDAARSPGAGSTGLGLAIVHAVVTAHGGTIEVDGTPGATAFTVTLPAADVAVDRREPALV